ncbi:MAG TPA: kelch repeat-containing protein [Ignavibacteriales bacterium]|nr:kelch repeat-containing protein [Ignavibacteriales bacterium]
MSLLPRSRSSGTKSSFGKFFFVIISLIFISSSIMAQYGAWTKKAPIPTPVGSASASVVDNKIFVLGGMTGISIVNVSLNQVYDPATNSWTIKTPLPTARGFLSTAVVNDIIYVMGGGYPTSTKVVEAYDPKTDTWTKKADMLGPRIGASAAVVDGIIYNIGGNYTERSCEAYDPKTNTWTAKTPMPSSGGAVAVTEYNGLIYVFGGGLNYTTYNTVFAYDPKTDTWTKKSDMPTARYGLRTFLANGKIYAVGGGQKDNSSISAVEVYDPVKDTWDTKANMPFTDVFFAGAVDSNIIYILSGTTDWVHAAVDSWQFDPSLCTEIASGDISGVWTLAKSPYHINGAVTIPKDSSLTIEPGVEVIFMGHYKMNVQGRILAIGTASSPVIFTAMDQKAGWHGIRFINTPNTNDTSKLVYCSFKFGKANTGERSSLDRSGGAVLISGFDKVLVSNSLFAYNISEGEQATTCGAGVGILNASPVITKSTFIYNSATSAAAIGCAYTSKAVISYNTISKNSSLYGGGIITANTSDNRPVITGNTISENRNNTGGGGGGIVVYNYSNPLITNNIIVNNQTPMGGGISCSDNARPIIINNTIANNSGQKGGGLYLESNSNAILINNIIYGNTGEMGPQVYLNSSNPIFHYNNIQGGKEAFKGTQFSGTYANNIDNDPIFMNKSLDNYALYLTSPSIGAGADSVNIAGVMYYAPPFCIMGNPRPSPAGTKPDQGACESLFGPATSSLEKESVLPNEFRLNQNYPNPFNPSTVISYSIPYPMHVTLKVFDLLGREVATLVNEEKAEGIHNAVWKADNISSGVYFYELRAGNFIEKRKMMLIR